MENNNSRDYNCKDIELIVICGFTVYSLKRDLTSFTKYSPKYNDEYVTALEAEIETAKELVEPQSELVEQKAITDHMHTCMESMLEPLKWVKGYIELAGTGINISAKDFGLIDTRKSVEKQDIEGVIKGMHTVNSNIEKYKSILVEQGLSDELQTRLLSDAQSIADDRQKQYELVTNRKALLQNNVGLLNALYAKIAKIHAVGKILFKGNDPIKLQEYTLSDLLKKVRRTSKPDSDTPATDVTNVTN